MSNYNILWREQKTAYDLQKQIHYLLDQEYKAHGLVYGGRMLYEDNWDDILYRTNVEGIKYGWGGDYKKLDAQSVKIHQDILDKLHSSYYVETNKALLDKMKTLDLSGLSKYGFQKVISSSAELIYDLHKRKDWAKEVSKILSDANRKRQKFIKELSKNTKPQNLVSMQALEQVGRAILGRSVELCPIETGFLRSSARLYVYSDHIRVIYECPYATYVHENINNIHPYGQAKFLEVATQEILGNSFVWVDTVGQNEVMGTHYIQTWEHDSTGKAYGTPKWELRHSYSAVYVDVYRDLSVNYNHFGTK